MKYFFFKKRNILPGFIPTFTFTFFYLSLIVLIPLGVLILNSHGVTWEQLTNILENPRVKAAFYVSFGISFLAGLISLFFGIIIAWVLVNYRFPGRRLLDGMIDLPFAMPTAVSGITLAALYARNGWIGQFLHGIGVDVAFTPLGILVALIFISFPFTVRSLQPVLEELDKEMEEAAACLGATRWQTIRKIIFPQLVPAILTGFTMAVARALGEYGSVIFIAGNIPYVSEILPLLIIIKLEQFDYQGAIVLAVAMLIAAFILLLAIKVCQRIFVKT